MSTPLPTKKLVEVTVNKADGKTEKVYIEADALKNGMDWKEILTVVGTSIGIIGGLFTAYFVLIQIKKTK